MGKTPESPCLTIKWPHDQSVPWPIKWEIHWFWSCTSSPILLVTEPPLFCGEATYSVWFSQGTRLITGMDLWPRLGHYKSPQSQFRDRKVTQARVTKVLTGLLEKTILSAGMLNWKGVSLEKQARGFLTHTWRACPEMERQMEPW